MGQKGDGTMTSGNSEERGEQGAVVVLRGNHILLMRGDRNGMVSHNLPGSRPRPGETPEEACQRELKETAGLIVEGMAPIGVLEHEGATAHLFLVDDQRDGTVLSDSSETIPANGHRPDWVPVKDVRQISIFPEALHVWLLYYLLQR